MLFRSTRIVIDPWLTGNPACPEGSRDVGAVDLVLVTHGHWDHTADVVPVALQRRRQICDVAAHAAVLPLLWRNELFSDWR